MRVLLAVLVLFATACSPDVEQRVHAAPGEPRHATFLPSQDRDFLERAAQGSNAEVAMGTLATHRGVSADVRVFGQRMITDHTAINARLAAIALRRHMTIPKSLGDHQASFDRLVDLQREPFDDEFMQVMIEDHDAAFELFRAQASGGIDPELKSFAASTLPLIEAHLAHAKAMASKPLAPLAPQ